MWMWRIEVSKCQFEKHWIIAIKWEYGHGRIAGERLVGKQRVLSLVNKAGSGPPLC